MIKNGFILSKQVKDIANALQISLWVKSNNSTVKLIIDNELALFFIESSYIDYALQLLKRHNIHVAKFTPLDLKTFNHQVVTALYFRTLRDFYQAREALKKGNVKCYEDDIRPDERYLMERFITADIDFIGNEIIAKDKLTNPSQTALNYHVLSNNKCKSSTAKSIEHLKMLSLDIECSMQGDLYSIGLYSNDNLLDEKSKQGSNKNYRHVLMIGEPEHRDDDLISWHKDEKSLLIAFIKEVQSLDVDIFIGWNVINFDFKLMQERFDLHKVKFAIGRDGTSPFWRENRNNSDHHFVEIAGRVVLDGIDLLKSATYSFPSFSLDNVANTLLGIGKKVDDVENRIDEINHNFRHNKQKLAEYNLEDCRLVWLIFEKTQLLEFSKLRSQLTGLAIDKVGGSVAAFTNLYLPKLHRAGYVAPNMGDGNSDLISPGGYVMDSKPGLYKNVLVLDFKSLYPSIIRSFKIDPMGLIKGLTFQAAENNTSIEVSDNVHDNVIMGFDGAYFSRTQHFLPDIIEKLWQERDKAKLQKNAALSQAIKIIMNSFYGVLGSTGCRFYDPRLSGSITKRSHEILKVTTKWIEDKGFKVIYGDTDSLFIHAGEDKTLLESKAIGNTLQDFINEKWTDTLRQKHQIASHLEIEFETHFTQFLMPTIRGSEIGTKKRYAGLVADLSGRTSETKLIFKGLESVRTDWTQLAKDFQKKLYLMVFNQEPIDDYIKQIVERTQNSEFDDKLIYRKRIRRNLTEYVKNVPPHVKAARNADEANAKLGKPLRYQKRGWVSYYITLAGPQAVEHLSSPLDYDFYIERQLSTVADAILPFIGTSFNQITDKQLGLF